MTEPTQKQIKEFWERCGFRWTVSKTGNYWVRTDPSGTEGQMEVIIHYPSIDLNNLFKYAVPKLQVEYRNWKSVLHNWVDELTGDYEKDTLSLFCLIKGG